MNWWRRVRHLMTVPRRFRAEGRLLLLPVTLILAALYVVTVSLYLWNADPALWDQSVDWWAILFRVLLITLMLAVLVILWVRSEPPRRVRWVWDWLSGGVVAHSVFGFALTSLSFMHEERLTDWGRFLLIYSRSIWAVTGGIVMITAIFKLTTELANERREREAIQAVVDFTHRMTSLDNQAILDEAVSHIHRLLRADACVLFLWSEADQALIPAAAQHDPSVYSPEYIVQMMAFKCPKGFGLTGWTMETGKPIIVGDVMADSRSQGVPGWQADEKSSLLTPIQVEGNRLGVVRITRRGLHQFSQDDLDLAMSFSGQAALVIEHGRVVKELQDMAITDSLTGLFNGRYFQHVLAAEVHRAKRHDTALTLVMMDSDSLKRVNDMMGHQAGDEYLRRIGHILRDSIRLSDYAFRYAGDEFILLLPNTGPTEALLVAERIRSAVAEQELGVNVPSTISLGVAVLPFHAEDGESLLSSADRAMYESKRSGKNRVTLASEAFSLRDLSL